MSEIRKLINLIESIDTDPEEKKRPSGWWWKDGGDRPQIPEPPETVDDADELAELLHRALNMHSSSDPEGDAVAKEEINILKKALLELKPIYERILRMRYGVGFEEMDEKEVAKELGIPPINVAKAERHALKILRTKLDKTFPERKDNAAWSRYR